MLPPEKLLGGVPYRNRRVTLEENENGAVLWAPLRRRWWMRAPFNWIMSFSDKKGFRLDPVGLEVWKACDGERTIQQIINDFSREHRVSFHEARIAVMQFVQTLAKRELVAVVFNRRGD